MASSSIQVACPQCGSTHQVNMRLAGRTVRCPHCDAAVVVPAVPLEPDRSLEPSNDRLRDGQLRDGEPGDPIPTSPPAGSDGQSTTAGTAAEVSRIEVNGNGASGPVEDAGRTPIVFSSDPVFDSPGHHSATDLPDLPPALRPESEDDDLPTRAKRKEDELDMTPMVDVTFLLLIFFMVTASFSLQKSIEMPRQQTDAPSTNVQEEEEEELDMVTVQIDEYGSFLVHAADWERETPGKQNLTRALREAIGEGGGAVRLVIEVHEDAKLLYLVDCMDAGTIAGYSEIQVTQVDGFD